MKKVLLVGLIGLSSVAVANPFIHIEPDNEGVYMWSDTVDAGIDSSGNMYVDVGNSTFDLDLATQKELEAESAKLQEGINSNSDSIKELGNTTSSNSESIQQNSDKISANENNISNNSDSIQAMGDAFEDRVDNVNGWLKELDNKITANSAEGLGDRVTSLESQFQTQAAHTASEIARLDGRIDSLEKKTDKLKAGVAGATAIASLTQYVGNGTHHVAVGIGGYDGASALAGGYTYAFSANTTIRATIALDSEDEVAFGTSVGHSW